MGKPIFSTEDILYIRELILFAIQNDKSLSPEREEKLKNMYHRLARIT